MSLSVITAVYNGGRFIAQCIENVLQQGYNDVEHVIVDGNSLDDTVEIIKQYAATNCNITWISEKDGGQSHAMNKGIALAKGKIIGFLNVDDFYEEGALKEVCQQFNALPEPSLLVGNCNILGPADTLIDVNKPRKLDLVHLLAGDDELYPFPINPSAYFYHKSLHQRAGLYDVAEHYAMDIDFLLRAIPSSNVHYVDRVFGNYRYVDGTKTFQDMRNGTGGPRFQSLLDRYRQQLPVGQTSYLEVLRAKRRVKVVCQSIRRIASRLRHII